MISTLEKQAIVRVVSRLVKASRTPGDMPAGELAELVDAFDRLAEVVPTVVAALPALPRHVGQLDGARHVKTGGAGTWKQAAANGEARYRALLKDSKLDQS